MKNSMRRLGWLMVLLAGTGRAQDLIESRVPADREAPAYVTGSGRPRWYSSQVFWYYNPLNQPANLRTQDVVNAIQVAAARWSGMCNITFTYLGTTTLVPDMSLDAVINDGANVFGWGVLPGDLAPYSAVTRTWTSGSFMVDTDIMVNMTQSWRIQEVEAVFTHELGHAIGLKHSDVVQSVMFANPYHDANYQRTLRGDDAEGCASLYGASSLAASNRAFNWAEEAYPQYVSPGPAVSASYGGYYYRYYPGTRTYLGSRDGHVYFMGQDGVIQDVGTLDYYTPWAHSWGY